MKAKKARASITTPTSLNLHSNDDNNNNNRLLNTELYLSNDSFVLEPTYRISQNSSSAPKLKELIFETQNSILDVSYTESKLEDPFKKIRNQDQDNLKRK